MTRSSDQHDLASWQPERRHTGRVATCGTVELYTGDLAMRGRVIDLSARGVRVRISAAQIAPSTGTRVRLLLMLEGGDVHRLSGHIARIELRATSQEMIIRLCRSQGFDDVVQGELLASLECADTPRVLLVDGDLERRARLRVAFRTLRFDVVEASSALEAIANRVPADANPWAVVLADAGLDRRAEMSRSRLVTTYPRVPIIAVGVRGRVVTPPCLFVDCIPDLVLQLERLVEARDTGGA